MRRLQATFVCAVLVRRCRGCTPRKLIVDAGPAALARVLEFFAARIANRRTRAAYRRAVGQCLAWCQERGLALELARRLVRGRRIPLLSSTALAAVLRWRLDDHAGKCSDPRSPRLWGPRPWRRTPIARASERRRPRGPTR